jgi:hypothetical protein
MTDKNDSEFGISRRSALMKIGGTAGSAALVGLSSTPAAAMKRGVHKKWARRAAEQVKSQRGNGHILVDEIAENADEPDENGYACSDRIRNYECKKYSNCGEKICETLDHANQAYTHYRNPERGPYGLGRAHKKARWKAEEARDEATDSNTNWSYVAEMTARSIHYIQDVGTLVHAGKGAAQSFNRDIHKMWEVEVRDNWDRYFSEGVSDANGSYDGIESASEVQAYAELVAGNSHDALHDNWEDLEDPGDYNYSTWSDQRSCIRSATQTIHGTIDWIYNGG